jgi:hypothetical protein
VEADAWEGPVPSQLVVLDGTWSQVRRLQHDNPWLADLPAVSLPAGAPSRYRIREEPEAHCLSTLEAVARVLRGFEPAGAAPAVLMGAFDALVDAHLAAGNVPVARHKTRNRPTVAERLQAWDDVVVAYGETAGLGRDRRLLQWAAVRPATGEVFDRVVAIDGMDACAFDAMELPQEADGDVAALREAWRAWHRPSAPVFGFSSSLGRATGPAGLGIGVLGLKTLYGRARGAGAGRLDAIVEREGLDVQPVAVRGRARRRLGRAVALAQWLRDALRREAIRP